MRGPQSDELAGRCVTDTEQRRPQADAEPRGRKTRLRRSAAGAHGR